MILTIKHFHENTREHILHGMYYISKTIIKKWYSCKDLKNYFIFYKCKNFQSVKKYEGKNVKHKMIWVFRWSDLMYILK